ncbi:MAG TPA: zinc-binding dehydrogenase [Clostridiaceae bacterium]
MLKEQGRAAVWTGKRNIEIMEFPIPVAGEDGAVIKVEDAAVCGTDGHLFPQEALKPSILGHEVCGRVVDIGKRANKTLNVFGGPIKVGDRVVLYPWITCGKCGGCLTFGSGTCTVCDDSFVYGIPYDKLGLNGKERISSDVNIYPHFKGGFGEYLYIFPETYIWKVPEDMPSQVAALLDPLAVAVRAVELACTCPGIVEEAFTTNATVTIIGDGPVGALAALVSRIMGVEKIIIIGGRNKRLAIASEISQADYVINYKETSPDERIKKVRDISGGQGADVVLQCSNSPESFVEGLEMIRRMGTLVEVGNMVNVGTNVSIDPARLICLKHARVMGMSANSPKAFNKAFHILKRHNKISFEKLYTHVGSIDTLKNTLNSMKDDNYFKGLVKF